MDSRQLALGLKYCLDIDLYINRAVTICDRDPILARIPYG